jgi:hypothetical protein
MRATNWSKAGQVPGWSAFLADENETGFKGWFGSSEQLLTDPTIYAATTSGLNNNDAAGNGVLEGTLDLPAHFGAFPAQIYVAAAPFSSPNGGALVSGAQVPEGNGDGDIQPNELLLLNTRDLALDLPTVVAGADQAVEAGMRVSLNGAVAVPSGLPATISWMQLTGPNVEVVNAAQPNAEFTFGANVAQATDLTFRLRVNDTRFDVDDEVTIQLLPMIDSDGDGLSNGEELTGLNNVLTIANPAGQLSDPNRADTDGDGSDDGAEALAGTNPTDAASLFRITGITLAGSNVHVTFSTVPGRAYQLQQAATATGEWSDVGGPIIAAAQMSEIVAPANASHRYLRVRLGAQ